MRKPVFIKKASLRKKKKEVFTKSNWDIYLPRTKVLTEHVYLETENENSMEGFS